MTQSFIDILDENGVLAGRQATKKEIHEEGWWHQTAHVWIYNSQGEILLQKRSVTKDSYPGLWDISVGGHVDSGESPVQAALREMEEEVGIKAEDKDLKKIGVRKSAKSLSDEKYINNEFQNVYLYKFDGRLENLKIRKEEIEKVKFIPKNILKEEIANLDSYENYVHHGDYYFDIIKEVEKLV